MMSSEQKIRFIQLLNEAIDLNQKYPNDMELENFLIEFKKYYLILFNPLSQ